MAVSSATLTSSISTGDLLTDAAIQFVAAVDTEDADSDGSSTDSIGVLAAYSGLAIPASTTISYCEFNNAAGSCFDAGGNELPALSPSGTTTNTVYISFSDFDLDQDGTAEGCTGSSCPADCASYPDECASGCPSETTAYAPVCVRIWSRDVTAGITDITPTIAMRLDRIPCNALLVDPETGRRSVDCLSTLADTDTSSSSYIAEAAKYLNTGEGAYRAKVTTPDETVNIANTGQTWTVDIESVAGVTFNHAASDDSKSTEVTLMQTRYDNDTTDALSISFTRASVYQDIVSSSGETRNRLAVHYILGDYSAEHYTIDGESINWFGGTTWLKYLERALSNRQYWSGYSNSYTEGVVADNVCAQNTNDGVFPTAQWVDLESTETCEGLQIDVSGLDFDTFALSSEDITATRPNDVDFPRDQTSEFPVDYCNAHATFTGCP
ncbi:MAG: hypothetical protein HQM16_01760 [Deltaproteobacteria bacterium]|nr:hypothetical protein [Deltaproteobacteria bacterium]